MMREMYERLGISSQVYDFGQTIIKDLRERFDKIDETAEYNQMKVLAAMQKNRVSEACLGTSTGYGYNDLGRDTLEAVYASVFHGESALVRPQLISGTHALNIALSGNLRPGDELLSPVGKQFLHIHQILSLGHRRENQSMAVRLAVSLTFLQCADPGRTGPGSMVSLTLMFTDITHSLLEFQPICRNDPILKYRKLGHKFIQTFNFHFLSLLASFSPFLLS